MKSNLRYGIRNTNWERPVFLGTMIVVGMGQEKEAAASEQNNTTVEESGSLSDPKVKQAKHKKMNK